MIHDEVLAKMKEALEALKSAKPKDRSLIDRRYQIVITDFEKLIAYFDHCVVEGNY